MKSSVTFIADDSVVIVDGYALFFTVPGQENIHAAQWKNGAGHVEFRDGSPNLKLSGQADYDQYVSPLVSLWEAEKERLEAITEPAPTDEERYNAERSAAEAKYSAPWNGSGGGILTMLQTTIVAALATGSDTVALYAEYNSALDALNAELSAIDEKWGVA